MKSDLLIADKEVLMKSQQYMNSNCNCFDACTAQGMSMSYKIEGLIIS